MALKQHAVYDPEDGSLLGHFRTEETTPPDQLAELAAQATEHFLAKKVEKLSTPNVARKIQCQMCGDEHEVGRPFNDHMEFHNREKNLGEKIE